MDYTGIVQRAIDTTRRHRALWVVGLLWALTGGGSGGVSFGNSVGRSFGNGSGYEFDAPPRFDSPWLPDLNQTAESVPWASIFIVLAIVIPLVVVLLLVMAVAQYVLQAGIYRGLDSVESEGWRPTVRGVWRLGWHSRTWRLFFQDLIVGIPFGLVVIASLLLALSPLLLLIPDVGGLRVVGIVGAVSLASVWVLATIVATVVIGVFSQFWRRAAVVDDMGVFAALAAGMRLARSNAPDAGKMWILMLGVSIVWSIIWVFLFLMLLAVAVAVAGVPSYYLYQRTDSLLAALLYGVPVGILILVLPSALVQGIYRIFDADVWTLVYRELVGRTAALRATP